MKSHKSEKNKLIYILTLIVIIIVYIVIRLARSSYLFDHIYYDNIGKQPINNIRCIDETIINVDDGDDEQPIEFIYDKTSKYGNRIYMINQFPISDETGQSLQGEYKTFDFKLVFKKNSRGVRYIITANKMNTSDLPNDWIKMYLEADKKGVNNCFRPTSRIKTFNEYTPYEDNPKERIIYEGLVTDAEVQRGYKNYTFRMWVSEDVKVFNEEYLERTFNSQISVHVKAK